MHHRKRIASCRSTKYIKKPAENDRKQKNQLACRDLKETGKETTASSSEISHLPSEKSSAIIYIYLFPPKKTYIYSLEWKTNIHVLCCTWTLKKAQKPLAYAILQDFQDTKENYFPPTDFKFDNQFLKHGNFTTHCFQNSYPTYHHYNSLIRNRLSEKVQMGYFDLLDYYFYHLHPFYGIFWSITSISSIHFFCILSASLYIIPASIFSSL